MSKKLFTTTAIVAITFALTVGTSQKASAEMIADSSLGAANLVAEFNNLNGGQGVFLHVSRRGSDSMNVKLRYEDDGWDKNGNKIKASRSEFRGIMDAYTSRTSGSNYFYSMATDYKLAEKKHVRGWLDFDVVAGTTSTLFVEEINKKNTVLRQDPLTIGAAYLYALFATSEAKYSSKEQHAMAAAIRFLIDDPRKKDNVTWTNNTFLSTMAKFNDADYWTQTYNPDKYYTEIGNYSVFALNVEDKQKNPYGGFLYIAEAWDKFDYENWLSNNGCPNKCNGGCTLCKGGGCLCGGGGCSLCCGTGGDGDYADIPEPATLAILGMGLAGLGVARRRAMKKK